MEKLTDRCRLCGNKTTHKNYRLRKRLFKCKQKKTKRKETKLSKKNCNPIYDDIHNAITHTKKNHIAYDDKKATVFV